MILIETLNVSSLPKVCGAQCQNEKQKHTNAMDTMSDVKLIAFANESVKMNTMRIDQVELLCVGWPCKQKCLICVP